MNGRARFGLALLAPAFAFTIAFFAWEETSSSLPIDDVPFLRDASADRHVTFEINRSGEYVFMIEAHRLNMIEPDPACVLGVAKDEKRCERLDFAWHVRSGDTPIVSGRYAGAQDLYGVDSPYVAADLAVLDLNPGSYVLDLTDVHVPASFYRNAPLLEGYRYDEPLGGVLEVFPIFILLGIPCALAALAGVALLLTSLLR